MVVHEKTQALVRDAIVDEHVEINGGYRRLRLNVPDVAAMVEPGQFAHLRVPHLRDRILRRPFSIFKADSTHIEILYKCVGVGTEVLAYAQPGTRISVLGPLGHGFPEPDPEKIPVLVGGGYGSAAIYLTAARSSVKGLVFLGGRTADDILCVDDFLAVGWQVQIATNDGSLGTRGMVTDVLDGWMVSREGDREIELFTCGPHAMLQAVGERAIACGCRGWISLDRPMGCGVGACLACVQKMRAADGGWEYMRTCKEGPVFECRDICWEDVEL